MVAPILVGRTSWFGGPGDPESGPTTASGAPVSQPGIAVYNKATLGGYWKVTAPNGRSAILKQTDIGPAPWTGRKVDVTYSAVGHLGYSTSNFPTDSQVHAEFLGKSLPKGQSAGPITPRVPGTEPKQELDTKGLEAARQKAAAFSLLGKVFKESGGTGSPAVFNQQPNPKDFLKTASPERSAAPESGMGGFPAPKPGEQYVNPHDPGFTQERTDMGVDFSAKPGEHIKAIGDGKVLGISPDWYKGQPYLYYELTSGPRRGQVIYVAEQIEPLVKPGEQIKAGQPIARYAKSGTGIEEGFGTRSTSTKAQASGNTGDATHGNSPAGIEYEKFFRSLK